MDIITDTQPSTSFITSGVGTDVPPRPRRTRGNTDDIDFQPDTSSFEGGADDALSAHSTGTSTEDLGLGGKNFGSMNDGDHAQNMQGGNSMQPQSDTQGSQGMLGAQSQQQQQQNPIQAVTKQAQNLLGKIEPEKIMNNVQGAMQYPLSKTLVGLATFYLVRRLLPPSLPFPVRNGAALLIQQGLSRQVPKLFAAAQNKVAQGKAMSAGSIAQPS